MRNPFGKIKEERRVLDEEKEISSSSHSKGSFTSDDDSERSSTKGDENKERGNWNHQLDFILSMVGYAVGLGNIWRFPYLCMRNGGGAFLIPYFIFLFICGMPLFYMEVCLGQFSSLSALHVWKVLPLFQGVGWGMMIVSGIVCIYYNVIITWVLYYLYKSFTKTLPWSSCDNWWNTPLCSQQNNFNFTSGSLNVSEAAAMGLQILNNTILGNDKPDNVSYRSPAEEFWQFEVLQMTDGIHDLGGLRWQLVIFDFVGWLLCFLCLFKGVKSLGKVVYFTATVPYVFLIILFVRGITMEGSLEGIKYYITPQFHRLLDFKVWGEACIQIFYTLGPAWGGIITMASYNKFNNNGLRDTLITCFTCCGTSFLAGFVVFSIIGFMAHEIGAEVQDVITSGPGLVFIAYPEALSRLPVAPMWAVFFFLMLLTIGLDSQFGMVETLISGIVDLFPKYLNKRKTLVTSIMSVALFLLGLPTVSRGGVFVFQLMDWYTACIACMTISILECVGISYIYGLRRFMKDIKLMRGSEPSWWWGVCWAGITPFLTVSILIFNMLEMSPPSYGNYIFPDWSVYVGWCLSSLSVIPIPCTALYLMITTKGTFVQRIKKLISAADDWGPALDKHRKGTIYERPKGPSGLALIEKEDVLSRNSKEIEAMCA